MKLSKEQIEERRIYLQEQLEKWEGGDLTSPQYGLDFIDIIADLEKQLADWKKAVVDITPGGSEFVDNPRNCVRYFKDRTNYPTLIIELRKQLADAQAQPAEACLKAATYDRLCLQEIADEIIGLTPEAARQAREQVKQGTVEPYKNALRHVEEFLGGHWESAQKEVFADNNFGWSMIAIEAIKKVMEQIKHEAANEMLRMVQASIEGYPDHGGDIGIMKAMEQRIAEAVIAESEWWNENHGAQHDGNWKIRARKRIEASRAKAESARKEQ